MNPLTLLNLSTLMERSSGNPRIRIGLIDGPVMMNHPALTAGNIFSLSSTRRTGCVQATSTACTHGTFVAGILSAKRSSTAPAICPGCTLLVRPLFTETGADNGQIPSTTPDQLATAIMECMEAGAQVINLSLALAHPSVKEERALDEALDAAARRGIIIVAAAGNQGTLGSSAITRHPWVIPVAACDLNGQLLAQSNLAASIARHGVRAPGQGIVSLGAAGRPLSLDGTSVATPFVTGTIALLRSLFPTTSAVEVKGAVTIAQRPRPRTVVPSLLDAGLAYQRLAYGSPREL
jgi:subtilisin family serine protease